MEKLREQAEGVLANHRKHPDPEVRLTIRDLLKSRGKACDGPSQMHGLPMTDEWM